MSRPTRYKSWLDSAVSIPKTTKHDCRSRKKDNGSDTDDSQESSADFEPTNFSQHPGASHHHANDESVPILQSPNRRGLSPISERSEDNEPTNFDQHLSASSRTRNSSNEILQTLDQTSLPSVSGLNIATDGVPKFANEMVDIIGEAALSNSSDQDENYGTDNSSPAAKYWGISNESERHSPIYSGILASPLIHNPNEVIQYQPNFESEVEGDEDVYGNAEDVREDDEDVYDNAEEVHEGNEYVYGHAGDDHEDYEDHEVVYDGTEDEYEDDEVDDPNALNARHAPHEKSENDESDGDSDGDGGSKAFNCNDTDGNTTELGKLLRKARFLDPITTPVDASPGGILLNVLKFSFEHSLSQAALCDLLKLVNSLFAEPVIPETRYFMDKFFNSSEVKFHALCPECDAYVGEYNRSVVTSLTCSFCSTKIHVTDPLYKNFFIVLDPSSEIRELLQSNDKYYNHVVTERVHEKGVYKDIYDGKQYRKFVKSLEASDRKSYATCSFNSDGSPVFESSTFSIWPIQIMINELPYDVRTNKLIVCALWFGKKNPDMNTFLDPFVKMMNNLSENGIACQILDEDRTIKVFPILCCVDTVARAPMQGFVQFNGHFGCNWCLHPGEWVQTAPGKGSTKYPMLQELPQNRTERDTLKHMKESIRLDKPVYGVKNVTPLINLLRFLIIIGFVPDYMHCLLLGVGKQFTNYFLNMVSQSDIEKMDRLLLNIKFPRLVSHLTRPLLDIKHWKAKDWENWILYSSIPVLSSVLERKYLLHWIAFVEAFHLLLSTNISVADVERAHCSLVDFVAKTELYYNKTAMTYNVHQLLHIAQSVVDWGPLWAHSGFAFESGNGQMLKYIQCAKGVTSQISRAIALRKNEVYLKTQVFLNACRKVKDYYAYMDSKITKKTIKTTSIRYFGTPHLANSKWIHELDLSENVNVYYKMIKDNCLFQSSRKTQNKRSNNTFAQMSDGRYIEMLYFMFDAQSRREYTACKIVRTVNAFSNRLPVLRKVAVINPEVVAVPTNQIYRICVFLELADAKYICAPPHIYVY